MKQKEILQMLRKIVRNVLKIFAFAIVYYINYWQYFIEKIKLKFFIGNSILVINQINQIKFFKAKAIKVDVKLNYCQVIVLNEFSVLISSR